MPSCQGCGRETNSQLCCPKCTSMGRTTFFCSQNCFESNWAAHVKLHKLIQFTQPIPVAALNTWEAEGITLPTSIGHLTLTSMESKDKSFTSTHRKYVNSPKHNPSSSIPSFAEPASASAGVDQKYPHFQSLAQKFYRLAGSPTVKNLPKDPVTDKPKDPLAEPKTVDAKATASRMSIVDFLSRFRASLCTQSLTTWFLIVVAVLVIINLISITLHLPRHRAPPGLTNEGSVTAVSRFNSISSPPIPSPKSSNEVLAEKFNLLEEKVLAQSALLQEIITRLPTDTIALGVRPAITKGLAETPHSKVRTHKLNVDVEHETKNFLEKAPPKTQTIKENVVHQVEVGMVNQKPVSVDPGDVLPGKKEVGAIVKETKNNTEAKGTDTKPSLVKTSFYAHTNAKNEAVMNLVLEKDKEKEKEKDKKEEKEPRVQKKEIVEDVVVVKEVKEEEAKDLDKKDKAATKGAVQEQQEGGDTAKQIDVKATGDAKKAAVSHTIGNVDQHV
eukprot:Platyproteum_vivax@DN12232_c0_g1_i1.p1